MRLQKYFSDIIPSYKTDNLKERYNEALLEKADLTLKEKESVMKELNLNLVVQSWTIQAYADQSICQN